jgi:hypothetical protein
MKRGLTASSTWRSVAMGESLLEGCGFRVHERDSVLY